MSKFINKVNAMIDVDHNLKRLTKGNIGAAKIIRTEDGYTFYKQPDGQWLDSLPPDFDMSYANDAEVIDNITSDTMTFYYVEDLTAWYEKYKKDNMREGEMERLLKWQKAMGLDFMQDTH